MQVKAYLQITMKIYNDNRTMAAQIYTKYRTPFLDSVQGALTKNLLIRNEDVQVLHGFDTVEHAHAYLETSLFKDNIFASLKQLWDESPEVKIYSVA